MRRILARRAGKLRVKLGRSDRALYDALEQLRSGVPLNWTQIEDDPQLQVLAYLSTNETLMHERGAQVPMQLRQDAYDRLSEKLPKPQPKPQKQEPKALAGFSESVTVLTQADEIPDLRVNFAPWIKGAVVVAVAIVIIFLWAKVLSSNSAPTPDFRWIVFTQDGKQVSHTIHPAGWTMPACKGFSLDDPAVHRGFAGWVSYRDQAQKQVSFPLNFITDTLPISPTYTFRLLVVSFFALHGGRTRPNRPRNTGQIRLLARQSTATTALTAGTLTIFQGKAIPIPLTGTGGTWRELHFGQAHAIYWRGAPYDDMEGNEWIGDVSVMAIENGDDVSLYVGEVQSGMTEEMLTALITRDPAYRGPCQQHALSRIGVLPLPV